MINPHPKKVKQLIRELGSIAYEHELVALLEHLEQDFKKWRGGEMESVDLAERIHVFHDKTSRELYKRYWMGELDFAVAYAIVENILRADEVDARVMQALAPQIAFAKA